MISLRDDFAEPDYDARPAENPGAPCPPEDIEFWKGVFGALLPPEDAAEG
jgi:hypothetical protein